MPVLALHFAQKEQHLGSEVNRMSTVDDRGAGSVPVRYAMSPEVLGIVPMLRSTWPCE
jgi:hypothetical protein